MRKVLFFFILTLIGTLGVSAATKSWVPTTGGAWTTATNWNPSGAPAAGDDIIIPTDQSADITAVPAITLNSLTINGTCLWAAAATGNTITITTSMSIATGKTLTLGISGSRIVFTLNGTATINGNLAFDAGNTIRNFTVSAGATLIVTPSGRVYDPARSAGGVFILSSGATLKIGNTGGILTGITTDTTVAVNFWGSYQYSSGANYEYNGTSAQGTGNGLIQNTPANVTISNSAGVTFSAPITISGNLSIGSGAFTNLSTFTHSVPALYLGGVLQSSGTWGGTGSGAANINTTYFAPASGVLYVNTPLPGTTWLGTTSTDWAVASNWNNGVPTASTNVIINSGGNQPSIGAASVCNNMTINTGATLTIAGANTLTVSGNWTNSGTFIANSSTVIFNGSAQTVGTGPFNNLTLSTSGVKITTGVTVNGTLSMEGRATVSAAPTYGVAATLQYNTAIDRTVDVEWITPFAATGGVIIANTGTMTLNAAKVFNANVPLTLNSGAKLADTTFSLTLSGNLINNGATTRGSGGLTIAGTATQSIGAFATTGTVSMTKTGGTATFTGNLNGGAFTLNGNGGTLDLGSGLTHTFTGAWTRTNGILLGNSSTIKIGGSVSGTAGTFTCGTGTVEWNAAGAQTIAGVTYNNLTLSGSGAKTVTGVTVTGSLVMNGIATVTGTPIYGGSAILSYGGSALQTTGAELPATMAASVTINNANGVTLNRATTINGALTLTNGNLTTTTTNLLTLGSAVAIGGGSASSFVNGPLSHTWTTSTATKTFPVGSSSVYCPVTVAFTTPASPVLRMQMVNSNAGGNKGTLGSISTIRYFQTSLISGTAISGGTVLLTYDADDGVSNSSNLVVAQSSTLTGTYSSLGMSANDASSVTSSSYNPANGGFLLLGSTGGNSLPIELTSFTAKTNGSAITLNWQTATEVNNYGFEIERRAVKSELQTASSCAKIGFVKGAGTSNSQKEYSYADATGVAGSYAYRLKQIDQNGTFKYSQSVEVMVQAPAQCALHQNYPNPFNPSTRISYDAAKVGTVRLAVYDVLGREVAVLVNGHREPGSYTAEFNGAALSSGIYFFKMTTEQFSSIHKMILMK
jgi:hypothetical protein